MRKMRGGAARVFVPLVEEIIITVLGWAVFAVVSQNLPVAPFTAWAFPAQGVLVVLSLGVHLLAITIGVPPDGALHHRISGVYCSCLLMTVAAYAVLVGHAIGNDMGDTREPRGSYATSRSEYWSHGVLGYTTWRPNPSVKVSDPGPPIVGTAIAGSMLGYVCTMLLVSVYASYCAAPKDAWAPILFEPKGLLLASGFVGLFVAGSLDSAYRNCSTPVVQASIFGAYTLFLCMDRTIFDLVVSLLLADPAEIDWWWARWQLGWYPVFAIVPPIFVLATGGPVGAAYACIALSGIALVVGGSLWAMGSPYSGQFAVLQVGNTSSASEPDPVIPTVATPERTKADRDQANTLQSMFMRASLSTRLPSSQEWVTKQHHH